MDAATREWTYGDAGDKYPVQLGDIWKVGPHMLACGDLEAGAGERFLEQIGKVDMAYIDPPWNAGNAAAFRTKAGQPRKVDFSNFLRTLISLARGHVEGDVYIEMGNATVGMLRAQTEANGGVVLDEWGITYYKKNPCRLIRARFDQAKPVAPLPSEPFEGIDDDYTPYAAIELSSRVGESVLDLCTGRGGTAVAAEKLGRVFVGTELHPRRLAVALEKLANLGAGTPEKVGTL